MKTRPVPRILVVLVLTLALGGATAPATWAAPAATAGFRAPALDFGWVLDWLQGFFGGWVGDAAEEDKGLQNVTHRVRSELDPEGALAASESPTSEDGSFRDGA